MKQTLLAVDNSGAANAFDAGYKNGFDIGIKGSSSYPGKDEYLKQYASQPPYYFDDNEPYFGWCDAEGCENEGANGGGCWRETGYWIVCSKHSQEHREGKPQPQMKQSAIEREKIRGADGVLPSQPIKDNPTKESAEWHASQSNSPKSQLTDQEFEHIKVIFENHGYSIDAFLEYFNSKSNSEVDGWVELANQFVDFSIKTFKEATAVSSLEKLDDEIKEVAHEISHGHKNLAEEYTDCLMCIFDSAARMKITPQQLKESFANKLEINKGRTWIKNANNTYSHKPSPKQ